MGGGNVIHGPSGPGSNFAVYIMKLCFKTVRNVTHSVGEGGPLRPLMDRMKVKQS